MTRNEVERILESYREAKKKFIIAKLNFDEELEMLTQIQIDYSKIKVQSSPEFDKIGGRIERLADLRRIYEAEADEAIRTMEKVKGLIESVQDVKARELLTRRYIRCERWEQIAENMHYSRAQVFRVRDKGVEELCRK